jgi:hypothetical protein
MAAPPVSSLAPVENAVTAAEGACQTVAKAEVHRGSTQGQTERVDATTRPCRLTTKCPECHKKFYSQFNLGRHMRTRHQGLETKSNKELQRQGKARKRTEKKAVQTKKKKMPDALPDHAFAKKAALNPCHLFSVDLWLDPQKGVYFCTLVPKSM